MKPLYSLEAQISEKINSAAASKGLKLSESKILRIRDKILRALDKINREENESLFG